MLIVRKIDEMGYALEQSSHKSGMELIDKLLQTVCDC